MFDCVLRIFFIISRKLKTTNEFHILNIWNRKCRSMSRMRKMGLTPFDSRCLNVYCWFYLVIILAIRQQYENERILHIINIWNRKCRSRSRRRKTGLTAFNSKCMNVYLWFFPTILPGRQHTKTKEFHILNFWNQNIVRDFGVQFSWWRLSMANVKIYMSSSSFCSSSYRLR